MSEIIDYESLLSDFFDNVPDQEVDNALKSAVDNNMTDCIEEIDKINDADEPVVDDSEDEFEDSSQEDDVQEDTENTAPVKKQKKRINTTKVFDNTGFYNGGFGADEIPDSTPIRLSPVISDQYDYSICEDIVLLQERKDTAQIIYEIFNSAPFADSFKDPFTGMIKIPKTDVQRVFYYVKDRLLKRKKISAFECVIAICEFFDMSYDYVVKKVLSSKMKTAILDDYYNNMGKKKHIDEQTSYVLF